MSEYQYIHFLAIDRPLDDRQLEYMQQQSTRAEITRWEFTNEYHFGDFRGNAREMLRRGYDVHLHYANFGIRRLMFRLPAGLPCDRRTFDAFRQECGLEWHADKNGPGGILEIYPESESDGYDEIWDGLEGTLSEIAPVREALIRGDLRPLYLAWLACNGEDEAREPPVPAGLGNLTPALEAFADFFAVDEDLIAAAAERAPPLPETAGADNELQQWLGRLPRDELAELAQRLLAQDAAAARAETLARVRAELPATAWPLAEPARTLGELRAAALELQERRERREQAAAQAAHRRRLKAIAADPQRTIAKVQELVKQRSVAGYEQAASELADLREALGPERGPEEARAIAGKLHREHSRLHFLTTALRKRMLID